MCVVSVKSAKDPVEYLPTFRFLIVLRKKLRKGHFFMHHSLCEMFLKDGKVAVDVFNPTLRVCVCVCVGGVITAILEIQTPQEIR